MRPLQIYSFPSSISRNKKRDPRVIEKSVLRFPSILSLHGSMNGNHCVGSDVTANAIDEVVQGLLVFCKDNELLVCCPAGTIWPQSNHWL